MGITLHWERLELRTKYTFHIARAAAPPLRTNVWVRAVDADGGEGWGEAAPSPYYGETVETVHAVLPRYGAVLQSARCDASELERIERDLAGAVRYNAAARAAVSAALHDLVARRLGIPIWRLWGLSPSAAPRSCFTIGIDDPAVMRERVAAASSYDMLKIKVGTERDEEVMRLVRQTAPHARIRVDANTAWTAKQALQRLPLLQEVGVELIEQPLAPEDLDGMRILRERSSIPIVADESCRTAADIPRLAGCVDGINIKLAKCGSLREAVRMVHVARAHGMLVMLGCMVESTLAIATAIQLAPLCDFVDLDGAALLAEDPFVGPGMGADGTLRFNDEPGLGVTRA